METVIYRILGICLILVGGFLPLAGGITFGSFTISFSSVIAGIGICIFLFPPSKEVTIKSLVDIVSNWRKKDERRSQE